MTENDCWDDADLRELSRLLAVDEARRWDEHYATSKYADWLPRDFADGGLSSSKERL